MPVLETPLFTEKLYEKKPDVVSGVRVLFSGIAKSSYKSHLCWVLKIYFVIANIFDY